MLGKGGTGLIPWSFTFRHDGTIQQCRYFCWVYQSDNFIYSWFLYTSGGDHCFRDSFLYVCMCFHMLKELNCKEPSVDWPLQISAREFGGLYHKLFQDKVKMFLQANLHLNAKLLSKPIKKKIFLEKLHIPMGGGVFFWGGTSLVASAFESLEIWTPQIWKMDRASSWRHWKKKPSMFCKGKRAVKKKSGGRM